MDKKHFVLKLTPRRPNFAQTMTDEEKQIVQQHTAYWKEYMKKGVMLIFGPVLDPKGVYGLGIIEVDSEEQIRELMENDPASVIHNYEYCPMKAVTPRGL
ncbi:MAG: YciI family protein [Bacteroidota bacterium]